MTTASPSTTLAIRSQQSILLEILALGAAQLAAGKVISHDDVFAKFEAEDSAIA